MIHILYTLKKPVMYWLIPLVILGLGIADTVWGQVIFFDPKSQKQITDGTFWGTEEFVESQFGMKFFGLVIHSKDPKFLPQVKSLKGGDVFTPPATSKSKKRNVVVGASNAELLDEAGKPILRVTWSAEAKGLVYDNCPLTIINAFPKKNQASIPFPVAIHCDLEGQPPRISISIPAEISWDQHDFREVAGKGERWRIFELPPVGTKSDQETYFSLRSDKKIWKISLILRPLAPEAALGKSLGFDKVFSVGYQKITLKTDGTTYSSSDTVVRFEGLTEPLWKGLRFGLFFKFNAGLLNNPNLVFSKDIGLSLGYYLPDADGVSRRFSLGTFIESHALDYKHGPSNFTLQASIFTVGAQIFYIPMVNHRLKAGARYGRFGSSLIKTNLILNAAYQYRVKLFETGCWLGVSTVKQSLSIINTTGSTHNIVESLFLLSLDF